MNKATSELQCVFSFAILVQSIFLNFIILDSRRKPSKSEEMLTRKSWKVVRLLIKSKTKPRSRNEQKKVKQTKIRKKSRNRIVETKSALINE